MPPVGDEGKELEVYLPPSTWYDWYTLDAWTPAGNSSIRVVETPLDYISVSIIIEAATHFEISQ